MSQQVLQGIEYSFPNIDEKKVEWAFESLKAIGQFSQVRRRIEEQLKVSNMMKLTRERLKLNLEMVESQLIYLSEILKPYGWASVRDDLYANYVLENPGKSSMMVNYDYLFRDWIWGEKENQHACNKVITTLPAGFQPENILVLGSGAGRLAYDLFENLKPSQATLVDMNPLLMMASKKIISGEELKMVEFPYMPASKNHVGILQNLKAPRPYTEGFRYIMTDARTYDFSQDNYDLIVTPWLIDVIDMDLFEFCYMIHQIGDSETLWVNYGPLGFNSSELRECYSTEEVLHIIAKQGFKINNQKLEHIDYMHSPYSHSLRVENVLSFCAQKDQAAEKPKTLETAAVAEWKQNPDQSLGFPADGPKFSQGYELNVFVLKLLEEQKSYNEVLEAFQKHFQASKQQAITIVDPLIELALEHYNINPLR